MSDLIVDVALNSIDAIVEHFSANRDAFAELKLPLTSTSIGSPTRIKILAHAVAVFQDKGIDDTTVNDFMSAAGVSRRTFYKYFKNRLDVLESLYQIGAELQTLRFINTIKSCRDLDDLIARSVDLYFDFHGSLGLLIRRIQEDALRSSSPLYKHRDMAMQAVSEVMLRELARVTDKDFTKLQIYSALWSLESASLHLLNHTDCGISDIAQYKSEMRQVMKSLFI